MLTSELCELQCPALIISVLTGFVLNGSLALSNQEPLPDEPPGVTLRRGPVLWRLAFAASGWPAPQMPASDGSAGFSFLSDK